MMRYPNVDISKGFLIILVIVSHIPNLILHNAVLLEWIHSFFMPSFYLLSGIFFKGIWSRGELWKKVKRLLAPYLVFTVWGHIAWVARTLVKHDTDVSQLYSFLLGGGLTNGPIWFLESLLIVNIISAVVLRIPWRWLQWCIVMALAGLAYCLHGIKWIGLYTLDTSLLCLPFFYVGYAWRSVFLEKTINANVLTAGIVATSTLVLYCLFHAGNGLAQGHVGWPFVPFYLYVTLFTWLMLYVGKRIETMFIGRWLNYIGKRSLGIMGLHLPLISYMYFILWMTDCYHFNILILGLVVLFESLLINNLIEKRFPWMLGRSKK